MTKATLTENELFKFIQDNPSIPTGYCTGILLQQKGIRFKPSFDVPTYEHMIPPWETYKDRETGDLYVTQGEINEILHLPDGTISKEPLDFMSDDYYVLQAQDYEDAYEMALMLGLI